MFIVRCTCWLSSLLPVCSHTLRESVVPLSHKSCRLLYGAVAGFWYCANPAHDRIWYDIYTKHWILLKFAATSFTSSLNNHMVLGWIIGHLTLSCENSNRFYFYILVDTPHQIILLNQFLKYRHHWLSSTTSNVSYVSWNRIFRCWDRQSHPNSHPGMKSISIKQESHVCQLRIWAFLWFLGTESFVQITYLARWEIQSWWCLINLRGF